MTWIVTSLFEILLSLLKETLALLAANFVGNLGINIGAKFPSINGDVTLMAVLRSMGEGDGLFDEIFKGAGQFSSMFVLMGITLAFVFGITAIYSSMVGPLDNAEHPFAIAPRMIGASVLCALSYQIFLVFEYVGQKLYLGFQEVAFTKEVLNPQTTGSQITAGSSSYDIVNELEKLTTNAFNPDLVFSMTKSVNNGALSGTETGGSLLALVICIICIFLILINFFKLLLEMVERYAVLGMLFYTCPVAFSTLATKKTSGIFSSWIGMVVSQLILMITNCFFLNTFIGGLVSFGVLNFLDLSISTYVVYMLLLVGWLKIGQNVDQYLKGLGLSTAQCGGHLSAAVGGAVGGLVASAVKMGTDKGMKAIGGKISEKAGAAKAMQAEKAANIANKQDMRNRQNEYFGKNGNSSAVKDGANIATGLKTPAAKAEAEKMVKSAAAMANGGVAYSMNDGGAVKIGKNLGTAGMNGVSNISGGNGGQIQLSKDSPQARKMANLAAGGNHAAEVAAKNCAKNGMGNSEVNSYSLSGNRGDAFVASNDNGMMAFASSATNSIHPTLQRAGVSTLSGDDGVISVSSHRFEGEEGVYTSFSGGTLSPYEEGKLISNPLDSSAPANVYVCAGDINREGLDYLNDLYLNEGNNAGWQGSSVTCVTDNGKETVCGIEMDEGLYKEMKNKGYFEKLDENQFADAAFSDPDVELNLFDFGIK